LFGREIHEFSIRLEELFIYGQNIPIGAGAAGFGTIAGAHFFCIATFSKLSYFPFRRAYSMASGPSPLSRKI
jgi:hypothetical protein